MVRRQHIAKFFCLSGTKVEVEFYGIQVHLFILAEITFRLHFPGMGFEVSCDFDFYGDVPRVFHADFNVTHLVPAGDVSLIVEQVLVAFKIHELRLNQYIGSGTEVQFHVLADRYIFETGTTFKGKLIGLPDIPDDLNGTSWNVCQLTNTLFPLLISVMCG